MNEYSTSRNGAQPRGAKHYPFRDGAWEYRARGWTGTIPVTRRGTKAPLAKGVTGHNGVDPSVRELRELIREFPSANIGLRLPWDIIGIDVDAYDNRGGDWTIRKIERKLGCPLPITWRSTSRDDGVSGIYLFRAPREPFMVWRTDLGAGSGVEIAQYHHRFATVRPSIHNMTGQQYQWLYGDVIDDIPSPSDLPLLPVKWGNYLLNQKEYAASNAAAGKESMAWYARVAGGKMCKYMSEAAEREVSKVRDAGKVGGLHDTLIAAVTHLCINAAEGHTGLDVALNKVEDAFKASGRRRNLVSEWNGAVNTARSKAAALRQLDTDVCSIEDEAS